MNQMLYRRWHNSINHTDMAQDYAGNYIPLLPEAESRWMFVIVVINLNSFLAILVHQGLFIISPFILPWVERQEGRWRCADAARV